MDTIEGYRSFLEQHGKKEKYADPAAQRLEELAFEQASREDTHAAYVAFLRDHPTGRFSSRAAMSAEDRRAEELGIRLYRALPNDYYEKVNTWHLPYRILVRASATQGEPPSEIEMSWYTDLVRRDLFVPMHPRKTYPVSPDIIMTVQQAVIYPGARPWAYVEAETWVRGTRVKSYRVAAWSRAENALLYEIFRDRLYYDALLGIPEEERRNVHARFEELKQSLPRQGSVALEVDIRQDASRWDREMALGFSAFLSALNPYEEFITYQRGRPPDKTSRRRIHLRVDPEIHAPFVRTIWTSVGPGLNWSAWNSKWIATEKDYFFRKMTLDLTSFLEESGPHSPHGVRGLGRPIYIR